MTFITLKEARATVSHPIYVQVENIVSIIPALDEKLPTQVVMLNSNILHVEERAAEILGLIQDAQPVVALQSVEITNDDLTTQVQELKDRMEHCINLQKRVHYMEAWLATQFTGSGTCDARDFKFTRHV